MCRIVIYIQVSKTERANSIGRKNVDKSDKSCLNYKITPFPLSHLFSGHIGVCVRPHAHLHRLRPLSRHLPSARILVAEEEGRVDCCHLVRWIPFYGESCLRRITENGSPVPSLPPKPQLAFKVDGSLRDFLIEPKINFLLIKVGNHPRESHFPSFAIYVSISRNGSECGYTFISDMGYNFRKFQCLSSCPEIWQGKRQDHTTMPDSDSVRFLRSAMLPETQDDKLVGHFV